METGYTVADVMTTKPVTASPDDTLREAAALMRDNRVGSLLLVRDEELVGIVTEFDLVRKALASGLEKETPVREVMTPATEMVTGEPGADVFATLNTMRDREVRHLPILDGERLVGLVTLKDILKLQPQLFELIVEKYDIREAERKLG